LEIIKKAVHAVILASLFIVTTGYATYKTLDAAGDNGPKFFSGIRLDLIAINKDDIALRKFKVGPPRYPLLDLPASFMLDAIVSPATGIMAISEGLVD
jgi:uncharacterized protein YceK